MGTAATLLSDVDTVNKVVSQLHPELVSTVIETGLSTDAYMEDILRLPTKKPLYVKFPSCKNRGSIFVWDLNNWYFWRFLMQIWTSLGDIFSYQILQKLVVIREGEVLILAMIFPEMWRRNTNFRQIGYRNFSTSTISAEHHMMQSISLSAHAQTAAHCTISYVVAT